MVSPKKSTILDIFDEKIVNVGTRFAGPDGAFVASPGAPIYVGMPNYVGMLRSRLLGRGRLLVPQGTSSASGGFLGLWRQLGHRRLLGTPERLFELSRSCFMIQELISERVSYRTDN